MSLSGITVPQNIIKIYEDKRFEKKEGGLILKIDGESLEIEKNVTDNFDMIASALPDAEPRYILYDMPVKNRANLEDFRTIFVFWMPMESPVRLRMTYSSTKSIITSNFRGIAMQHQEDEMSNMNLDYLTMKLNKQQGINNPIM